MTVASDAKNLQIDSAAFNNPLFIPSTKCIDILGHSLRNMDVTNIKVDVLKQVLVHEVMIALVMRRRQSNVLIKVKCCDLGKVQSFIFVHADKLFVKTERRASCG